MLLKSFRKLVDIAKKIKVLAISPKQLGAMDLKRGHDEDLLKDETKKQKTDQKTVQPASTQVIREDRKRKVALMTVYNGAGYCGVQVQVNSDVIPTIESELLKALVKVGCIPQDHADNMYKMSFQRSARTDKGVSALGQVMSLKMRLDVENLVEQINSNLPAAIRVIDYKRVTNGFDAKNSCSGRTYVYMLPTYSFAPVETLITEDYRITDDILTRVNQILSKFQGTHNFFNYTSGIKPTDPSANRYISSIMCGKAFVRDNMELAIITVKGQSFMMHHIRKIIGQTIAVITGHASPGAIDLSWKHEKLDIPKAPGLGLVLKTLHFDAYNKRYGDDGMHVKVDWSEHQETVDKFAEEHVFSKIVQAEKTDRVMLNWLATLQHHSYEVIETTAIRSGLPKVAQTIRRANEAIQKQKKNSESDSETKKEPATDDPSPVGIDDQSCITTDDPPRVTTEAHAREDITCTDLKDVKNDAQLIPEESQHISSTDTSNKVVDSQTSTKLIDDSENIDSESSSPKEQKLVRL